MSGLKNYQRYRLEIANLSMHFQFADDAAQYAHIMQDNATQQQKNVSMNNNTEMGKPLSFLQKLLSIPAINPLQIHHGFFYHYIYF